MKGGWWGRGLWVDLGRGRVESRELPSYLLETYLGGRGIGIRFLYDLSSPREDPLDGNPPLIFAPGPFAATPVPMGGRYYVTSKSPLTGTAVSSSSGGRFGLLLKRSGWDLLVIVGKASEPVYLVVDGEGASLKEAASLWGKEIPLAREALREREGKGISAVLTGPAGERKVRFACCENDGRFLGRGGIGAVMGAKGLKAVVVKEEGKGTPVARPQQLEFIVYEMRKWLEAHPITSQGLRVFGTPVLMNVMNRAGVLPVRNFQRAGSPLAFRLSGEELRRAFRQRRRSCPQCPLACGRITEVKGAEVEGPEYESLWALGVNLEIFDPETVILASGLCNRLGLDTISTGATLACYAELIEKGACDGRFSFGERERILEMIERVAFRVEEGELLAEGSRRMAEELGLPSLSMHSKGMELPAYDPRGAQGQGLAYATSPRGGCHLRSYMIGPEVLGVPKKVDRFSAAGKAGLVIFQENLNAALDSLVACRFGSFALSDDYYARALSAVTGIDYEAQDLHLIGERIWTLERLYNLREGISGKDDLLPERFLSEPLEGKVLDLPSLLEEYRRFRGWKGGTPGEEKLRSLGLI